MAYLGPGNHLVWKLSYHSILLFILWGKVLANYVERGSGETGLFILKLFTLGIVDGAKFRERGGREETEFETARESRG